MCTVYDFMYECLLTERTRFQIGMQQISASLVFQVPGENLPGISRLRNYIAETSNSNRMFEKNIP